MSMQNLISDPVSMTSCRQEAYLQRLRRQFPFVYIRPLTRTAFGRRVWALQLGGGSVTASVLRIGGIELDDDAKTVRLDGEAVNLTPKEYDILRFLMQNPGKVFSPSEIYRRVWDDLPLNADGWIGGYYRKD